jgi:type IV pilus assembly protein PilA
MLSRLRQRVRADQSGFTLVELLVVMLIIGLLAAIAIPAFFNQRSKATDANAKEAAHTSQVAMETYATDHGGSYVGATVALLQAIEPTVPTGTAVAGKQSLVITGTGGAGLPALSAYRVTVTAATTGNTFSIDRSGGVLSYPCNVVATNSTSGGCVTTTGVTGAGTWG